MTNVPMADTFKQDRRRLGETFCYYHERAHYPPVHCRYCGKDLHDARRWYCDGHQGKCGANWALRHANRGAVREILIRQRGYRCESCSACPVVGSAEETDLMLRGAKGKGHRLYVYGYHAPPNDPDVMRLFCSSCRKVVRAVLPRGFN